jgi:hypothetical protein
MSGGIGPSISFALADISVAISANCAGVAAGPPFTGCEISSKKRRASYHERDEALHAAGGVGSEADEPCLCI